MKNDFFKKLTLVFAICFFTSSLFAQGAYVNINAGYGLGMGSFSSSNRTQTTTSTTYENVKISFGKGLDLGASFGYMFNKNIGAELGLSYLIGSKTTITDKSTNGTTEDNYSAKMFRINPSLIIAAGFDKINPYAKLGLIVGSGSLMIETNDISTNGDKDLSETKFNGGFAIGLNAGVGVLYSLSEKMSLFGEINMVSLSYAPTKSEMTKGTFNGVDYLSQLDVRDKQTEYTDSYTRNNSTPIDVTKPSQDTKQNMPFGSVGLKIGLRINF